MSDEPEARRQRRSQPAASSVDEYLERLEDAQRHALEGLRRMILEIVPEAEEVISYGLPAFRLRGATIAGFAAFKHHLSYLPFSGSVLGQLSDELPGYTKTKSSLHFSAEHPVPRELVRMLVETRLADIDVGERSMSGPPVRCRRYMQRAPVGRPEQRS